MSWASLFPAPAGITRPRRDPAVDALPLPRICGDYPAPERLGDKAANPFPAPAGITLKFIDAIGAISALPRTCGDYPGQGVGLHTLHGSSPHLRGLPGVDLSLYASDELFPAPAGITLPNRILNALGNPLPRTCGDYPSPLRAWPRLPASSRTCGDYPP